MTWIQTRSGVAFDLINPTPEMVRIEDIAFSLARLCRFTGHVEWYSVAEHSYMMSKVVEPDLAFEALMHDATEAYIGDISKPLKMALHDEVSWIEDGIWHAIAVRFGLPDKLSPDIKAADVRMLQTERSLLGESPRSWGLEGWAPYSLTLGCVSPEAAEVAFLSRFRELSCAHGHHCQCGEPMGGHRGWPPHAARCMDCRNGSAGG